MVAEAARVAPAPAARRAFDAWLLDMGFVAFLLLMFVGLSPFAPRDAVTMAAKATGEGDALRQIAFLSVFALIVGTALWRKGLAAFRAISIPLVLTLAWCLASALWSVEPDVTLRRVILAAIVIMSALLSIEALGVERSLRIWRYVLIGILLVNWISVFVLPEAVHLPGDIEESVVGGWRGLYFHKNVAGAVSAVSAIVFLFHALKSRRWTEWLLFALAVGFTVMSQSKTSLGFLAIALVFAGFYRLMGRSGLDRVIGFVAIGFIALAAVAATIAWWDSIATFFRDPTHFTGRAAIWQAEIAYIGDHPFLGAGFGAFADTGLRSPLYTYMDAFWIGNIPHGHSGYLELAVVTGLTGLALALLALVLLPALDFRRIMPGQAWLTTMAFTIFAFVALHNIMESDFLENDNPQWVAFLFAIAFARLERRQIEGRQ
jgi:exopolysaccharide production protein ExoQ